MNINTLSETGEITIFQDADTGNTYIVEPVLGTTEPRGTSCSQRNDLLWLGRNYTYDYLGD